MCFLISDTPTIHFNKKRSNRSPNCYNIQEGKIVDRPPTRSGRYISPIRIKNKILCSPKLSKSSKQNESSVSKESSISNPSTPISRDSKQHDLASNKSDSTSKNTQWYTSQPHPVWDFDKGINSVECAKIGTISYREKRNPLASTRLSCYKPKISEHYSLPHYKSVDDFLFLNNSDEVTSNSSTSTVGSDYSGINQTVIEKNTSNPHLLDTNDNLILSNDEKKYSELHINEDEDSENKLNNENYDFSSLTTKSVENIFEPKLYALASTPTNNKKSRMDMANFSDKIKTMSSRTQKLFSKIYNNSENKSASSTNKQSQLTNQITESRVNENETVPNKTKPATEEKSSKSRRSLSYGNLPGLEDFRATLRNFHKSQNNKNIKEEINPKVKDHVKDDLLVGGEDTDSGILVNESGQSSIIETDDAFHPDHIACGAERSTKSRNASKYSSTDVNSNFEFKFVQLCIEEIDIDRCLGFGVKAVRNDAMNKRISYQVANIRSGGVVDR